MSPGLFAAWCLLAAMQLGWLPFARTAWAFDLWAYLPPWAQLALAAASLSLCWDRVRRAIAEGSTALARRAPAGPAFHAAAAIGVAYALWLVRERSLTGDSAVLVAAAHGGPVFVFPEVGATFLLRCLWRVHPATGLRPVETLRLLACVSGGLVAWILLRRARELAPAWPAALLALFLLSGGLARVFAGRVEVYAPLLAALLAYLLAALRALRGAGGIAVPALLLGVAIWLHAAASLLLPSLFAIPLLEPGRRPGGVPWRRWSGAAALASAPLASFLAASALVGGAGALGEAAGRVVEILGGSDAPDATRWWVRGWGGAPSVGTDVVLLGRAHLKYLANAFALLVPVLLPALGLAATRRRASLVAGPPERFLASAALPLGVYALALRPFWGPWDWDLFAATALVLACLAARIVSELRPAVSPGLLVGWIGFQLLFVGIPFLWIGAGTPREVGPFGFRGFDYDLRQPARPPPERIAPWL